jgi:serine protease DegQ
MKKLVLSLVLFTSLSGMAATTAFAAPLSERTSLAPMLEHVTPAVVIVSTTQTASMPESLRNLDESQLRRFFSDPSARGQQSVPRGDVRGMGSGVIVDAEQGYIVTNNHVIANADVINVALQDGREFKATLIGSDPSTDVALLQIEAAQLVALNLANIDEVRVGDYVVAIGNPFGVGQTVTQGIVSALGRGGLNNDNYEDFIQTDAAINMGNSGGALVNLDGELIGINTAIISGSGTSAGIAFAVPVNMISAVLDQLEQYGEVRRGQLGVQIQDLTTAMESALQTGAGRGALVTSVLPGSSAERAGLEVSDVIVAVDSDPVESGRDLRNIVGLLRLNQEVTLQVYRDGRKQSIDAVIGGAEPTLAANEAQPNRSLSDPEFFGAQLRDLDSSPSSGGVEVSSVDQGSPAWRAGLRPGDVIYEVNRNDVGSLQDFNELIAGQSAVTALGVVRQNRRMLVILS